MKGEDLPVVRVPKICVSWGFNGGQDGTEIKYDRGSDVVGRII